ncbi:hypothetical protein [Caulobacter vibrioides]|uniref:hypothetical protein n=1 Tax=Caulobacter vibrioides TaxID=155892 RepID=UPI001E3A1494|nr:hypothetical protein [Caulobacter vibrioides]
MREIQARNAAAHALEDARRDVLQSQIAASNAQERARTQIILRDLNTGVVSGPVVLRDSNAPRAIDDTARADADFNAAMAHLERLTQEALDQSNARMRAIRPASEPKR